MQNIAARPSGLQTALDVTIAPRTAFTNLRETPRWAWAFAISCMLGIIGSLAIAPVVAHVMGAEMASRLAVDPQLAALPAAERQARIAQISGFAQIAVRFAFVFIPFGLAAGCALQALVMLIANAIGKGDGNFTKFWALAVNAAVVGTGLASVALAIIVLIRGADGFASSAQITGALPGPAMFVPAGAKAAAAFFGVMNIFALWDMALLVLGMMIVARLSRTTAIVTAIVILLGSGAFPLIGALAQK
jgi:hypothetical protein